MKVSKIVKIAALFCMFALIAVWVGCGNSGNKGTSTGTLTVRNSSGSDVTYMGIRPVGASDTSWEQLSVQGGVLHDGFEVTFSSVATGSKDMRTTNGSGTRTFSNALDINQNQTTQAERTPTGLSVTYPTGGNTSGYTCVRSVNCNVCNIDACCPDSGSGNCYYDAGGTKYYCNGTDCYTAAQNAVNHCCQY